MDSLKQFMFLSTPVCLLLLPPYQDYTGEGGKRRMKYLSGTEISRQVMPFYLSCPGCFSPVHVPQENVENTHQQGRESERQVPQDGIGEEKQQTYSDDNHSTPQGLPPYEDITDEIYHKECGWIFPRNTLLANIFQYGNKTSVRHLSQYMHSRDH